MYVCLQVRFEKERIVKIPSQHLSIVCADFGRDPYTHFAYVLLTVSYATQISTLDYINFTRVFVSLL